MDRVVRVVGVVGISWGCLCRKGRRRLRAVGTGRGLVGYEGRV